MNHRGAAGFPWANEAPERSVRPLPADIDELRVRYPASDGYYDASVTNTWFKPNALSSGYPSPVVCDGDRLYARFAVNNGSTEDVDVVYQLFMSTDESLGSDLASPTWGTFGIDDAESALVAKSFAMPALVPDGGTVRRDWIPLRGGVLLGCSD